MLIRERALQIAMTQVGVKEVGHTNWSPKVAQYLKSAGIPFPAAWCMAFVHWCFEKAGKDLNHVNQASVGFFASWAAQMGYQVYTPAKADVICFNFDANLWPDHVGFVRWRVGPITVATVEGNTQPGAGGNQAEGGGVYTRVRRTSRCLFFRVPGTEKYQYEHKREARKMYLRSWILRKRKEGWSWKRIKAHPYADEYYRVLGGK